MTWWTSRASGACESLHEETVVQLIVLTVLQRRSIQIQACTYIPAFLTSGIPLLRVLHSLFIFHLTVKYLSSTYWVLRCWRRWASWGRPSLSSCRPASWSVSSYNCSRMYLIIFQLLDFCFLSVSCCYTHCCLCLYLQNNFQWRAWVRLTLAHGGV